MFRINIEKSTLANNDYRKIIYKSDEMEIVVMSLLPNEDIPWERHSFSQFIRIEQGQGEAQFLDDVDQKVRRKELHDGITITISPYTQHYIKNRGTIPLKLYSVYAGRPHEVGSTRQTNIKNKEH